VLETGPKGATLVTVDDGKGRAVRDVRALEVDAIRWSIVDVVVGDDAASLDEVLASIEAALRGTVSEARGEGAVADRLVIARLNLACPPRLREACSCRENELTDEARAIARGLGGIRVERVVVAGTLRPIDRDPPGEPR
jgi:hypothetical protein